MVEIPSCHWHDWWNAGTEKAIVVTHVSEGDRFPQMIETIWGLARDRRPPAAVQSVLFGLLRPIAKARGYRGTYPQYGRSLLAAE